MTSASARRVLIIVENLPVPPDRRVWQECLALRASGYEISVICPKGRGYLRSYEVLDGIHIYRHGLPFDASGVTGFVLEYLAAFGCQVWLSWRIFLTRGFDIIQACNPPDSIWLVAVPFRLLFGRKFVFDHHDPFPEMFATKFPTRTLLHRLTVLFERMSIRMAHLVITTSEALRRIAIDRAGATPDEVVLVRSCPDLRRMKPVAPDPGLRQGATGVVVYVGIMGAQDGVDLLLRAAHEILHVHRRQDIRYIIVGDGPEFANLKRMAEELQIAIYVTFTGFLRGNDLLTALSSADIGSCPDPCNQYNDKLTMNKLLEYMAMELPTVMFELTEGRTIAAEAALYVPGGDDYRAMAKGILALLDDPVRRRRMGAYARQRVESLFDWNKERAIYVDAYSRLSAAP